MASKNPDPFKEYKESVEAHFTGFCSACHKTCALLTKEEAKKKLKGISVKSAKQKARRAQQAVRNAIRKAFGLAPEDVRSVQMGETGSDIVLSEKGRAVWPFHAVEVTASPNVSLMSKFDQAVRHGEKQLSGKVAGNGRPILLWKKNQGELFALVRFRDLLEALSGESVEIEEIVDEAA